VLPVNTKFQPTAEHEQRQREVVQVDAGQRDRDAGE
jgi:hypothetical protein